MQDVVGFVMTVNLILMKLSDGDVGGADGDKKEARRQRLTKVFTHGDIVGADEGEEAEALQRHFDVDELLTLNGKDRDEAEALMNKVYES